MIEDTAQEGPRQRALMALLQRAPRAKVSVAGGEQRLVGVGQRRSEVVLNDQPTGILTVQIGMGENILILAFVVIIIGGIGSIRGAFIAAVLVGLIDTIGRAFLPDLLRLVLSSRGASTVAPALSSMLIYLLMTTVLVLRPQGLFPVPSK